MTPIQLLVALVCLASCVMGQCPTDTPLTLAEAYKRADNVLLGRDVSNLTNCQGDTGSCSRRQIQFQVLCVLKQTQDLTMWNFSSPVKIGENRSVMICDRTFFSYDDANSTLVVFVTVRKDTNNTAFLDWQETTNTTRAHYRYGPEVVTSLGMNCSVSNPFSPLQDACYMGGMQCCTARCPRMSTTSMTTKPSTVTMIPATTIDAGVPPAASSVRMRLHAPGDDMIGTHCCKSLKAGAVNMWVSDKNDGLTVSAYGFNSENPEFQLTRREASGLNNKRLAFAVFTMSNESVYQVAWLSVNNQLSPDVSDGFQTIQINGLMPYPREPVLPNSKEGVMVHVRIYKHSAMSDTANINSSIYLEPHMCSSQKKSYFPKCNFKLEKFEDDYELEEIGSLTMTVTADDWSVYRGIRYKGVTARQSCPLINPGLTPYKNTVLCPVRSTSAAEGLALSSMVLLLSLGRMLL